MTLNQGPRPEAEKTPCFDGSPRRGRTLNQGPRPEAEKTFTGSVDGKVRERSTRVPARKRRRPIDWGKGAVLFEALNQGPRPEAEKTPTRNMVRTLSERRSTKVPARERRRRTVWPGRQSVHWPLNQGPRSEAENTGTCALGPGCSTESLNQGPRPEVEKTKTPAGGRVMTPCAQPGSPPGSGEDTNAAAAAVPSAVAQPGSPPGSGKDEGHALTLGGVTKRSTEVPARKRGRPILAPCAEAPIRSLDQGPRTEAGKTAPVFGCTDV